VVDAIDSVKAKAALIAYCREHAIPLVIVIGGAGGQTDPTKIEVRDLARTEQEPLLKKVRKLLRASTAFARGEKNKYHIDAVFSMEPLRYPEAGEACEIDAEQHHRPELRRLRLEHGRHRHLRHDRGGPHAAQAGRGAQCRGCPAGTQPNRALAEPAPAA
jgi:tRNA A37 threonylcarbamoyladenosine dehydratase